MLGWFEKLTSKSPEEAIRAIESAGIRFTSDTGRQAVMQEVPEYLDIGADVAESILYAMGDEQIDDETFEQRPWLSNDVWHFDYEAIEDHGAYKFIVENCIRVSGGLLAITELSDFVDVEEGKAWVEFTHRGNRMRFDLDVDGDCADPKLFIKLNGILKADGLDKRFGQHDLGQDCLIICRNSSEIANLNKLAGLNFRQFEG